MKLSAVFVPKKILLAGAVVFLICICLGILFLYFFWVPQKYTDVVKRYAGEYGVETELVYAVIRSESNFRPDAVSRSGARGLMQLMPSTAQFISGKIGEELAIDSPCDNIRMGVWYLSYLTEKFGAGTEVLAAYNAGEGTVRRWLNDPRYSSDGKTLQTVPFAETARYIGRVKKFYKCYKFFYE